ncbi:hypothetical protein ACS0TY_005404 [Phlomoides rotata]
MNSDNWLSSPLSDPQFCSGLVYDEDINNIAAAAAAGGNSPFDQNAGWNLMNNQAPPEMADFLGVTKSEQQVMMMMGPTNPHDYMTNMGVCAEMKEEEEEANCNMQQLTLSTGKQQLQQPEAPARVHDTFGQRTSIYRGVTRHRWTGRYEAHLWDNSCRREGQSRKGRQGGYDKEEKAGRAYDLAALKYWGSSTTTNFPISNYEKEVEEMKHMTRQEFVASIRRKSSGFSRGASMYRGAPSTWKVASKNRKGCWKQRSLLGDFQ